MLFTTITLLGTGWSMLKPFLSDREKKIFLTVLPLQVRVRVTADVQCPYSAEGGSKALLVVSMRLPCSLPSHACAPSCGENVDVRLWRVCVCSRGWGGVQVFNNIAYTVLSETAVAASSYAFWTAVIHGVDFLCCALILLPIYWSVRHLRQVRGVTEHFWC